MGVIGFRAQGTVRPKGIRGIEGYLRPIAKNID